MAAKLAMVRRLRRLGSSRDDIEELFRLIDWMLNLEDSLQLEFDEQLWREEQEGKVPFVSSIERRALERGRTEGWMQGQAGLLILQLEAKFGPLSDAARKRVTEADAETLREWGVRLLKADRIERVFG